MAQIVHDSGFDFFTLDKDDFSGDITVDGDTQVMEIVFAGSGFTILLEGTGFSFTNGADPNVTAGTVDTFILSFEDDEVFAAGDFQMSLEDAVKLLAKGKFDKFLQQVAQGDDIAQGSDGNEGVVSGAGDDLLFGDEGNDLLDGGKGEDTAVYMGMMADYTVTVDGKTITVTDNEDGDGDEGTDTLEGIEFLRFQDMLYHVKSGASFPIGTGGDDNLNGTNQDDILQGFGGEDTIAGLGGSDQIFGGDENDQLYGNAVVDEIGDLIVDPDKDEFWGGDGSDVYVIGKGDKVYENFDEGSDTIISSVKIKLSDNVENAVLSASDGASIRGNDLDNLMTGDDSDNKMDGRGGTDVLYGEGGMDTLRGGDGNDGLIGGDGDDRLDGGNGNDGIDGGNGDDRIDGGDGDDQLLGGDGDDELRGGDGADTFIFGAEGAMDVDRIKDFEIGVDTINLEDAGVEDFDEFLDGAVQDGKDVVFTAEGGARLILEKTDLNALSANDFEFADELILLF